MSVQACQFCGVTYKHRCKKAQEFLRELKDAYNELSVYKQEEVYRAFNDIADAAPDGVLEAVDGDRVSPAHV